MKSSQNTPVWTVLSLGTVLGMYVETPVTQIGTYFLPFNECLPFYAKYVRRYRTHLRKMIRTICEVYCVVSCFSHKQSEHRCIFR